MVGKRNYFVILAAVLLFVTNALALHNKLTVRRPSRVRHTRHLVWRPLFRGSHEMLVRQNQEINRLELPRIEDDGELAELVEARELVPVKDSHSLTVAENLPATRRYCRPWTREFLEDLSTAYYQEFRQPIRINSLVRTAEQQRKLRRHNGNAAPVEGETASTHLTGITVDIAKKGMSAKAHRWLERYLLPLKEQGLIEPVEERRQAVFHVVVYDSYSDWRQEKKLQSESGAKATSD